MTTQVKHVETNMTKCNLITPPLYLPSMSIISFYTFIMLYVYRVVIIMAILQIILHNGKTLYALINQHLITNMV